MHYATAVRRLRAIAEDCAKWGSVLEDNETILIAAYAYGPVQAAPGADLDAVHIALVVDLPAEALPWGVEPPECSSLAFLLRLGKAPVLWRWRPAVWPVWNHAIRRPMPIWTLNGIQSDALDALSESRAEPFRLVEPDAAMQAEQFHSELAASAAHLRSVRDKYWDDQGWRREHRREGRYPEHHLWDAVDGYLDLLDARRRDTVAE